MESLLQKGQTAKTLAKIFIEHWFHAYITPERIQRNQGRIFESKVHSTFP